MTIQDMNANDTLQQIILMSIESMVRTYIIENDINMDTDDDMNNEVIADRNKKIVNMLNTKVREIFIIEDDIFDEYCWIIGNKYLMQSLINKVCLVEYTNKLTYNLAMANRTVAHLQETVEMIDNGQLDNL